jgi:hypothetical protein
MSLAVLRSLELLMLERIVLRVGDKDGQELTPQTEHWHYRMRFCADRFH